MATASCGVVARVKRDVKQVWALPSGPTAIGPDSYRPVACTAHELVITNTLFRLPTRNKTTWMHPRSKHWHLIDYVISRKKDVSDVRVKKSMRGADCWTDHRLLVSKLTLRIQPKRPPQGETLMKRLNVTQLRDKSVSEDLTRAN